MTVKITKKLVAEQGLTWEEYGKIKKLLGREPNYTELGMFSAMWSEHCSYKNSKPVLKLFPTTGKQVLQGPGENAGVVDIGDGWAVAFKIESHNHPSAIEPYEASATGGGGCMRDIFTMGARPIALLGSLRFGRFTDSKVKYLLKEIARGFTAYANVAGVPVVGGEIYFDESYEGNPLVNAMTVGFMRRKNMIKARATGVGNLVLIAGGATGRDGIAGATLASAGLDEEAKKKSSAVAIGDPKMGRKVREACLELIQKGYVVGMQDMGAAGLTCSTAETAYKAGTGMEIDLSLVPCKEKKMTSYEVMLSESQERMLIIIRKNMLAKVKKIFSKWRVPADVIGRVTDDGMVRIVAAPFYGAKQRIVAEVPARALVEAPVYRNKEKVPAYLKTARKFDQHKIPEPTNYNKVLLKILSAPSIASKEYVYKKGDPKIAGNVQVGPGSDAAVVKLPGTKKRIAITVDCNASYVWLNPYRGGMIAVAEAARNLVCAGARPLAVTDCLNFGNPKNPEVFWQFRQSVLGISKACKVFNTPVVSGNVSFNNENPQGSIDPTPVIGMVGVIEKGVKPVTQWFKKQGDVIILLGKNSKKLDGRQYLKVVYGSKKGDAPSIGLEEEKRLQKAVPQLIEKRLVNSTHDCSEGGLAVALAECCISNKDKKIGATIDVCSGGACPRLLRRDALLFGESQSRIILSADKGAVSKIESIARKYKIPCRIIGKTGGSRFKISLNGKHLIDLPLKKLEVAEKSLCDL